MVKIYGNFTSAPDFILGSPPLLKGVAKPGDLVILGNKHLFNFKPTKNIKL